MRSSLLITCLSLFLTLTLAAPTPLSNTPAPVGEADTAHILPVHPHAPKPKAKTYGTYLHVADASKDTSQAVVDLDAVEAAKEVIKEEIRSLNLRERMLRFKNARRPRGRVLLKGGEYAS